MNGLTYLLQANLYLIIFFGFYWVLLRKETFNNYNRAYLIIGALTSFAIPLWNFEIVQNWFLTQQTTKAFENVGLPEFVPPQNNEHNYAFTDYISIFYLISCLLLSIKLIANIFNLYRYINGNKTISRAFSFFNTIIIDSHTDPDDVIYNHEQVHASQYHSFDVLLFEIIGIFCWFNPIIYAYKISIKNIHEFIADDIASTKLNSKVDYAMMLFSEQFQTHPSVLVSNFFTKTSLKLRIEMLNKTKSKKTAVLKYGLIAPMFLGMLIIASASIARGKSLADLLSFNKKIKGTVLNNENKPIEGATIILANTNIGTKTDKNGQFELKTGNVNSELVLSHVSYQTKQINVLKDDEVQITLKRYIHELQGTLVLFDEKIDNYNSTITDAANHTPIYNYDYAIVEKNAEYIGGTSALYEYLRKNLRYPTEAKAKNKYGIVYTSFRVGENGEISNVKIVNPLGYMGFIGFGLEAEAKRVVAAMPNWLPAIQNGKATSTDFTLPVHFMLDKKENKLTDFSPKVNTTQKNLNIVGKDYYFVNGKAVSFIELQNILKKQYQGIEFREYTAKETFKKYGLKGKNGSLEINHGDEQIRNLLDLKQGYLEEVFTEVEHNAEFPGGVKALSRFLSANMKYPAAAQRANVSGKVFLQFIVKKNGEITDISILKGLGFGLDQEAIRIVKMMPKWLPARQNNQIVNSKFNLPISYKIY